MVLNCYIIQYVIVVFIFLGIENQRTFSTHNSKYHIAFNGNEVFSCKNGAHRRIWSFIPVFTRVCPIFLRCQGQRYKAFFSWLICGNIGSRSCCNNEFFIFFFFSIHICRLSLRVYSALRQIGFQRPNPSLIVLNNIFF